MKQAVQSIQWNNDDSWDSYQTDPGQLPAAVQAKNKGAETGVVLPGNAYGLVYYKDYTPSGSTTTEQAAGKFTIDIYDASGKRAMTGTYRYGPKIANPETVWSA